jgi:hypothetical protein
VLDACSVLPGIIGLVLFVVGAFCLLNIVTGGEVLTGDSARKLNVWFKRLTVCFLVLILVPSPKTAYMMLGANLGKEAIQSETAQKIQKIVSIKLDEYLKELEK